MAKNYYIILGLKHDASASEVRDAYRRLAKEFHPDHYGSDSAPFLEIQEAYGVLIDPESRRTYDRSLRPARRSEPFRDVTAETRQRSGVSPRDVAEDDLADVSIARSFQTFMPSFDGIFDRLWSNFSGMYRRQGEIEVPMTFEVPLTPGQARTGGTVRLLVPAWAQCPTCHGHGSVGPWECWRCAGEGGIAGEYPVMIEYPAGIADGHTATISLEHLGIADLYLEVQFTIG